MKVYSSAGEQVGTIADVYFEEDGRIVGFEVSAGVVDDLASGRRFLPVEELDRVGDEIVYVMPETAGNLGPVPGGSGGASGALDELAGKAGDAARQAGQKLSQTGTKVAETIGSPTESEGPNTPGADLVGRRSGADVADAEGRIIVANGQLISQEHVSRAETADELESLRAAADVWSAAERDRVISGTVETVADAAGSAWDRFMGKISELTDETGKRMSEQQTKARLAAINDAVGRPVTKVILDRSDDVILNLGDIITHEAIQRAYEAGILDTLLDSVYKGEVAFERDEMKAATEGTSTVERAAGGAAIVEALETNVQSSDEERQQQSDAKRREADEAREQRETERQERARAREESAARAEAGEPLPDDAGAEADDREATVGASKES
jgi:sporulation protein YlmC with PRC-barrel domain